MENSILVWLQRWYASHCDGDWEHSWGIRISTLDNPGWSVKINLEDTSAAELKLDYQLVELSNSDWFGYSVKNSVFSAAGDPTKLTFLLEKFKELVTT